MHYKCTYQGWEVPTQLEKLRLYFGILFCQPDAADIADTVEAMDGERRPADSALQTMNSGLQTRGKLILQTESTKAFTSLLKIEC